jgi:hypothetical protein
MNALIRVWITDLPSLAAVAVGALAVWYARLAVRETRAQRFEQRRRWETEDARLAALHGARFSVRLQGPGDRLPWGELKIINTGEAPFQVDDAWIGGVPLLYVVGHAPRPVRGLVNKGAKAIFGPLWVRACDHCPPESKIRIRAGQELFEVDVVAACEHDTPARKVGDEDAGVSA